MFQITVSLTNRGDFPENAVVTLKLDTLTIATATIPLGVANPSTPGVENGIAVFTIEHNDTQVLPPGRYNVTALATTPLESLGNLPDNTLGAETLTIFAPGDIDLDGAVNLEDAILLAESLGSSPGMPGWRPEADLDANGVIDMADAAILAQWVDTSF
jgi:hypothetical protein